MNVFVYAAANPTNNTDPSGRYWGEEVIEGAVEGVGSALTEYDIARGVTASGVLSLAAFGGAYVACTAFTLGTCAVAAPVLVGAGLAGTYGTYKFAQAAYS